MLKEAVINCPDALWDNPANKNKFWHIAYHALFYAHFNLQPDEKSFQPWEKPREGYHVMDISEIPPGDPQRIKPYTRAEILEYHQFCTREVARLVPQLDLEAESGFHWLPFGKLELQLYNIRHIQQHAGELYERLGSEADLDSPWVGRVPR